jgi:hypothetical protein
MVREDVRKRGPERVVRRGVSEGGSENTVREGVLKRGPERVIRRGGLKGGSGNTVIRSEKDLKR